MLFSGVRSLHIPRVAFGGSFVLLEQCGYLPKEVCIAGVVLLGGNVQILSARSKVPVLHCSS
jgi:hypothetical protein